MKKLARVEELVAMVRDREAPRSYFRGWDLVPSDSARQRIWSAREQEFQSLDGPAWEALKAKAYPYLSSGDPSGRGWEQLISTLNEARAYKYLLELGCTNIKFLEERPSRATPDLAADLDGKKIFCEVKTINISNQEVKRRRNGGVGSISADLPPGFLAKVSSTIEKAINQLKGMEETGPVARMVFLILNFDDNLGEYKEDYYRQIDELLGDFAANDFKIVIFNQVTPFHRQIEMERAIVINENL